MGLGKMFCTNWYIQYWYWQFGNFFFFCIWPNILITDATMQHKQYLNDVALRTVRYSCRLSTAGTTPLYTQSVNSTNTTVHILQCFTVMNLDTLQHFPPGSISTPLSHTRLHLTNRLVWQNGRPCPDALIHLYVYRISTVCILVSEGETVVYVYLIIIIKCHIYAI